MPAQPTEQWIKPMTEAQSESPLDELTVTVEVLDDPGAPFCRSQRTSPACVANLFVQCYARRARCLVHWS